MMQDPWGCQSECANLYKSQRKILSGHQADWAIYLCPDAVYGDLKVCTEVRCHENNTEQKIQLYASHTRQTGFFTIL